MFNLRIHLSKFYKRFKERLYKSRPGGIRLKEEMIALASSSSKVNDS
jgi:hypothetical protein